MLASPNAIFGDIPRGCESSIRVLVNPFNYRHFRTIMLTPSVPASVLPGTFRTLRALAPQLREMTSRSSVALVGYL